MNAPRHTRRQPNPQGKGLVPVLNSLAASMPTVHVPPKFMAQISSELFTSLFVLNSRFQFKPVVGKSYWLFRRGHTFRLSLISPAEWGSTAFGQFVGECRLQTDITWTLALDPKAALDSELMNVIAQKRTQFEAKLQSSESLKEVLPVFEPSLPFYQRALAAGLARSLHISMEKSGIHNLPYEKAKLLLSHDDTQAIRESNTRQSTGK